LGHALLSQNGEMIAAAIEICRRQLETRPHLAEFMNLGGRSREVLVAQSWNST
jgi:hypothetical protein